MVSEAILRSLQHLLSGRPSEKKTTVIPVQWPEVYGNQSIPRLCCQQIGDMFSESARCPVGHLTITTRRESCRKKQHNFLGVDF
jgi:hypothetical protein